MALKLALKDGVDLGARHFDVEFAPVFRAILEKWPVTDDGCVWITEAHEDRPGMHGVHRGIDVRLKNIQGWISKLPGEKRDLVLDLQRKLGVRLGRHFDVVPHLELLDQPAAHIHIEYDPKG